MELALFFYAAGVIENLGSSLMTLSIMSLVTYFLVSMFGYMNADLSYSGEKAAKKESLFRNMKSLKWIPILSVSLILFTSILPSKDTMYTMAAAYGVQTAAENPNVQRVAGKSLQVLEGKLDEYLKADKKAE